MNFIKKNLCKIISLGYISLLPVSMLYAAQDPNCGVGKICPPINQTSLNGFIKTLLEGALKVGIPLIALAIIYCGFLLVTAGGEAASARTKAKDIFTNAALGLILAAAAWLIIRTLLAILGYQGAWIGF